MFVPLQVPLDRPSDSTISTYQTGNAGGGYGNHTASRKAIAMAVACPAARKATETSSGSVAASCHQCLVVTVPVRRPIEVVNDGVVAVADRATSVAAISL